MSGGVICDILHLASRVSDPISSLVNNFLTSLHPHPPPRRPALRSSVAVPFAYFQISLDTLGSMSFLTNLHQKGRRPPSRGSPIYIYL